MEESSRADLPPGEYVVLGGEAPDRKKASFRLTGDRLDSDAITRATGVQPHAAHRKGESKPPSRSRVTVWASGLWSLQSELALPTTGNKLEDQIEWLLEEIEPTKAAFLALCAEQDLRADFFCGYFMEQENSSFVLSANTLGRIAALRADVLVDIYSPDPESPARTFVVESES